MGSCALILVEEGLPRLVAGKPWNLWPETLRNSVRQHVMKRVMLFLYSQFLISLAVLENGVCETVVLMTVAIVASPILALSLAVRHHFAEVRFRPQVAVWLARAHLLPAHPATRGGRRRSAHAP